MLVVDYGAQYAQLIARRVREAQVYSEIVPGDTSVEDIVARKPAAVILSGGPASVYAEGARRIDPGLFTAGVPVLGLCYGFQAMALALGGDVAHDGTREYGRTELRVDGGVLHDGLPARHPVWMSHGDSVVRAPDGFAVTAASERAAVAAFEDPDRRLAGVQYHPEVGHSPHGQQVLDGSCTRSRASRAAGPPRRSSTRRSRPCAPRSATAGRSAGCPAASTPRWRPRSSSGPSATG